MATFTFPLLRWPHGMTFSREDHCAISLVCGSVAGKVRVEGNECWSLSADTRAMVEQSARAILVRRPKGGKRTVAPCDGMTICCREFRTDFRKRNRARVLSLAPMRG